MTAPWWRMAPPRVGVSRTSGPTSGMPSTSGNGSGSDGGQESRPLGHVPVALRRGAASGSVARSASGRCRRARCTSRSPHAGRRRTPRPVPARAASGSVVASGWLVVVIEPLGLAGAREGNRTLDLRITSALLCRLSYPGGTGRLYPAASGSRGRQLGQQGLQHEGLVGEDLELERRRARGGGWPSTISIGVAGGRRARRGRRRRRSRARGGARRCGGGGPRACGGPRGPSCRSPAGRSARCAPRARPPPARGARRWRPGRRR